MKFASLAIAFLIPFSSLIAADSIPDKDGVIPAPPQDQGLPYTRSAQARALEKIRGTIALCAGSRYGYADGLRVRLDQREPLHGAEARMEGGDLYVPADFAAVLDLKDPRSVADQALCNLEDRWVHTLTLPAVPEGVPADFRKEFNGKSFVNITKLATARGLKVSTNERGLVLICKREVTFPDAEKSLVDSVITLFDTPDRFADPGIAATIVPTLVRQGLWTNHVTVTSCDLPV